MPEALKIDSIEIVLKVSERCNIACTYCYFFFGADQSYREHAALLGEDSVEVICAFLRREIPTHELKTVSIALHGGEPLLMKKPRFLRLLEAISQACVGAELDLAVQTNAMLIDEEWIDIFSRFNVRASVSLDGPESINDRARLDKRGRGTHSRAVAGLKKLVAAAARGALPEPGLLCVIDPDADPRAVYEHFVDELGVRRIDFLLPDASHDSFDAEQSGLFGAFLIEIFSLWVSRGDEGVKIRVLDHLLFLLKRDRSARARNREARRRNKVVTISSDATIGFDDILRGAVAGMFDDLRPLSETSLLALFSSSKAQILDLAEHIPPQACRGCLWLDVCEGGDHITHRHSTKNGFDNPSVYCEDIMLLLGHLARALHAGGMSREKLLTNLT